MIYIESKKLKKKKEYIPYEFASKSPEACLIDINSPNSIETNRLITEDEKKDMFFLITNIKYLNEQAIRVVAETSWRICSRQIPIKISRVPKDHPFFGFRWYNVRYVGSFGSKALSLYLIQEEDERINPGHLDHIIIPGKVYIITAIGLEPCKKCGTTGMTFKVRPESNIVRCGACLGVKGTKKGL